MRRREFIGVIGGGALASAWPFAASAQQSRNPVIGYLSIGSPGPFAAYLVAFRQGLKEAGYIEGQNVAIEYRWAEGQYEKLPALAADLVKRDVAVITSTGGPVAAQAAKAATTKIPIAFITGGDPVKQGLVESLNRPRGNMTGVNFFIADMEAKRLGLLRDLVPNAAVIGVLMNPKNVTFAVQLKDVQEAARTVGQSIDIFKADSEAEIQAAFANAAQTKIKALLVVADPFFNNRREQVITLAANHSIPAIYELRDFAKAGGLMSYGPSIAEAYRQVGIYTGRLLKGEKPSDLPVVQTTKFEMVLNTKTAKALGLEISPMLLARADEVIE